MNNSSSDPKITDGHRARLAYLYIRQSTVWQVEHYTESTARQYELRDRAVALGWPTAPKMEFSVRCDTKSLMRLLCLKRARAGTFARKDQNHAH
jgi:hypothetical protein